MPQNMYSIQQLRQREAAGQNINARGLTRLVGAGGIRDPNLQARYQQQWSAAHPEAPKPAVVGGNGQMGTGPQGSPATAAPKSGGATPPPATTPPPAPPPAPPTFQGALTNQYGQGQPFGLQDWYGNNPIQTASDVANRELSKNLAGIRARAAAGGLGSSGREAIAEGTAAGEAATGLGDVLASRGIGARAQDVSTALNAFLGAGQQQLQGQANQIQYANQMANLGNAINQIGALEQGIPNAGLIEQLLGLFSQSTGTGRTRTSQSTRGGFMGM